MVEPNGQSVRTSVEYIFYSKGWVLVVVACLVNMCTGTESRGIIKDCDPLINGKDGDIEDYNNNNNNNNNIKEEEEEEEDTMRNSREYHLGGGAFIHSFLQWFRLKFPSNAFQLPTLSFSEVVEELKSLVKIAGPIVMTSYLIYSRSVISMLFLGRLGKTELAGGSLALGFGNITGYSILRGLSTGMDPICCQAYGAKRMSVLSQTFQKTVCLLLLVSIPISTLWLNMETIFTWLGQDPAITKVAKLYLAFSIPELLCQAHLQPLRIFLRTQGLTAPLTVAATCSAILHLPINYLLVTYLKLGVGGVALALGWNTLNLNVGLVVYIVASNKPLKPWQGISNLISVFEGWKPLLSLALPSCLSICLEWWWYEIIVFLCGLLSNPETTIGAMGILIQTTGMLYVFPISLSAALTTRVGYALGAGQPNRAQWTAILGIIVAFVFGIFALIFMTAMRSKWGIIYTDERQILDLVSKTLPVLGLCELANTPQTTACGVLNGTARPKLGAKINLYAFYLVGLPVAILATFTFKIGFLGLWYGLLSAQLSCLCMLIYTLLQTDWKQQSKRAVELTMTTEEKEKEKEKEKELEKVVVVVDDDDDDDEESALLSTSL